MATCHFIQYTFEPWAPQLSVSATVETGVREPRTLDSGSGEPQFLACAITQVMGILLKLHMYLLEHHVIS